MGKTSKAGSQKTVTPKTKGVLLLAFGAKGYGFAAHNMLLSIKHFNPEVNVSLLWDYDSIKYLDSFNMFKKIDTAYQLSENEYKTDGKIDPAKIKCNLYKYLPYDETLYLDVDGCATQDIAPLIERLSAIDKPIQTSVIDSGGKDKELSYAWAKPSDIWDHFKLKDDAVYPSVQTSWMYIKKSKEAERVFHQIVKNYETGFPISKLNGTWGGTLPDELFTGAAMAKLGYDPSPGFEPVFFGSKLDKRSFTQIESDHYILSLYGNGNGKTLTRLRYIEHYDRLMQKYCNHFGIGHNFKSNLIMKDKHSNKRK